MIAIEGGAEVVVSEDERLSSKRLKFEIANQLVSMVRNGLCGQASPKGAARACLVNPIRLVYVLASIAELGRAVNSIEYFQSTRISALEQQLCSKPSRMLY